MTRVFTFPHDPAGAICTRDQAVVYGFDGDLAERLDDLSRVLQRIGWGKFGYPDGWTPGIEPLELRESPALFDWLPTGEHGYPPGLDTVPPRRVRPPNFSLWVRWTSRGQQTDESTYDVGWPEMAEVTTPVYLPLEVRGSAYMDRAAAQALQAHRHVALVEIQLDYYENPNVKRRPGRMPMRLRPVFR